MTRAAAPRAHALAAPRLPASPWSVALLAALLLGCALALVVSQYRSRVLFAELETMQQETKRLEFEGARLRGDLGHAAQPASVEAAAHRLGMRPIDPDRVVLLPVNGPVPNGTARLAREESR